MWRKNQGLSIFNLLQSLSSNLSFSFKSHIHISVFFLTVVHLSPCQRRRSWTLSRWVWVGWQRQRQQQRQRRERQQRRRQQPSINWLDQFVTVYPEQTEREIDFQFCIHSGIDFCKKYRKNYSIWRKLYVKGIRATKRFGSNSSLSLLRITSSLGLVWMRFRLIFAVLWKTW